MRYKTSEHLIFSPRLIAQMLPDLIEWVKDINFRRCRRLVRRHGQSRTVNRKNVLIEHMAKNKAPRKVLKFAPLVAQPLGLRDWITLSTITFN